MTLFDVSDYSDTRPSPKPQLTTPDLPERRVSAGPDDVTGDAEPAGAVGDGPANSPLVSEPEVEVRVSARRKKTSEAKWVGNRIVVSLPAHLDEASRQKTIDWLVDRLRARHRPQSAMADDELLDRAIALSDRYLVGARPASVRWVTNQSARWGSCSYYSGHIRISHRLLAVPAWVLDSVLVHEVAHLTHPDHSPAFHRLAGAYPRHREAGTFLAGYGLGLASTTT